MMNNPTSQAIENLQSPQVRDGDTSVTTKRFCGYLPLAMLWVCLWLGNLLISMPVISSLIANKFYVFAVLSGTDSQQSFASAPLWMNLTTAALMATMIVAVTAAISISESEACNSKFEVDDDTNFWHTTWKRINHLIEDSRIVWLVFLALAYISLHDLHQVKDQTIQEISQVNMLLQIQEEGLMLTDIPMANIELPPNHATRHIANSQVTSVFRSPSTLAFSLLWALAACLLLQSYPANTRDLRR